MEHKNAVASFDQNSEVAGHVHLFGHNMNFENLKMFGIQYHERLFLEAWHSTLDPNSGNDHYQKPTKASREHELHGHARKLRVTLLSIAYDNEFRCHFTDEGLSIRRNVCYQLSRVSGKPFP